MVPAGNKAKRLSSANHTTKPIHHHHHHLGVYALMVYSMFAIIAKDKNVVPSFPTKTHGSFVLSLKYLKKLC